MTNEKPRIYCFINAGRGTDWVVSVAIAQDGTTLGQHVSSSELWAKADIGAAPGGASELKVRDYRGHYPDGYEIEWVEDARPGEHEGLDAAYALNQRQREAAEAET